MNEKTLNSHLKSKAHKKRQKLLDDTPYTQAEADAAGGLGSIKH